MLRNIFTAIAICALSAVPVAAQGSAGALLPGAQKIGEGRFSVLLWDIYDAALYAPAGRWSPDGPFILSLTYLRDIDGAEIADRSAEAMRKMGFSDEMSLAAWHNQMIAIFPDVTEGSELSGLFQPGEGVRFFRGGEPIGAVTSPEFARWFAAIWLDERTGAPDLRRQLLGL